MGPRPKTDIENNIIKLLLILYVCDNVDETLAYSWADERRNDRAQT